MANPPLDKKIAGSFRDFASEGYLIHGLEYLRRYHCPKVSKGAPEAMMHDSINLQGYLQALDDVENILTALPEKETRDREDSLLT